MGIVVLQESVRSHIEDLDFLIRAARGQAGAVRVELDIGHHACVVSKGVHQC